MNRVRLLLVLVLVAAAAVLAVHLLEKGGRVSLPDGSPPEIGGTDATPPDAPRETAGSQAAGAGPRAADPGPDARREITSNGAIAAPDGEQAGTGGISGRVVDESGLPVAGARIKLLTGDAFLLRGIPGSRRDTGMSIESGPDGSFHLGRLAGSDRYLLDVRHDAYARVEVRGIQVRRGDMTLVPDVVLKSGVTVVGTVRGPGGEPIDGAAVALFDLADVALPGPTGAPLERVPFATTATDVDGAFSIPRVHFNLVEIEVAAPGFANAARSDSWFMPQPPAEWRIDVTLAPGRSITGMVVDGAGRPIEGATVLATMAAPQGGAGRGTAGASRGRATSTTGGAFAVEGLADLPYALLARAAGFSQASAGPVKGGARDVRLVLEPQGAIAGNVVDPHGAPVAAFRLRLVQPRPDGTSVPTGRTQDVAAADGAFAFAGIDPGAWALEVEAEGFAPTTSPPVDVLRGETARADVRLEIGGAITGIVAGDAREPLAGATVTLKPNQSVAGPLEGLFSAIAGATNDRVPTARTGADGRFTLRHLREGLFQLRIEAPGLAPAAVDEIASIGGQTTDVGTLVLARGGALEGRCVTRDGQAARDVLVKAMDANGAARTTRPDLDGRFRFDDLAPGDYTVTLQPDATGVNPFLAIQLAQQTSQSIAVQSGATAKVTLVQP